MNLHVKCLVILFLPVSLTAQSKDCSCKFQAIGSVGLAAGESPIKPFFQFSAGKTYKGLFFGGGTGLDFYRYKSVPLFADLRYSVGPGRSVFLYNQAGYNFPFDNKVQKPLTSSSFTPYSYKGGFYWDAGLGYKFKLGNRSRLIASAGFSHKRINYILKYAYPCLLEPCPEDRTVYQYNLGRIVAKLGWEINGRK